MNRKDQESNPFEQSFSSKAYQSPPTTRLTDGVDTWVTDIASYTFDSNASSMTNESYSSVSDYQATPGEDGDDTTFHANQIQQQNTTLPTKRKRNRTVKSLPQDVEKRNDFLERNRIAALKCRQRKKQWLSNLQTRIEYLTNDNDQLQIQVNSLHKETMDLKTLLVAHKDCPQYSAASMGKSLYLDLPPQQHTVYHQNFSS